MNLSVKKQIKKIRDNCKLSQERFGKKIGLTGKAISTYETGRCSPPLRVLKDISETYNVSFTSLDDASSSKVKEKLEHIENSIRSLKSLLVEYEDLSL